MLRFDADPNNRFHFHFESSEMILNSQIEIDTEGQWITAAEAELNFAQGMTHMRIYSI